VKSDFTRAVSSSQDRELQMQKKKLRESCKEFETVMVNYLMKSMRDTISHAEEPEHGREMFEDMLAGQLSKEVGKSGSLGIGDILYRRLEPQLKAPSSEKKTDPAARIDTSALAKISSAALDANLTAAALPSTGKEILKK